MIIYHDTHHKRCKYVNGSYSRRADLQHYSPFTLWLLQKKPTIIKKPPYRIFTENTHAMGG